MSQGLIDLSSVTVREEKSQNTSNCSFFPLLPPFFSPQSFFHIHYKCVTGYRRVERGEQCVVTLGTALQLSAWLQLPLPAGSGGPGHRPSVRLPLHPLHHHHHYHQNQSLCDTIQTIHGSPCITVQCTTNNDQPCGSGLREREQE